MVAGSGLARRSCGDGETASLNSHRIRQTPARGCNGLICSVSQAGEMRGVAVVGRWLARGSCGDGGTDSLNSHLNWPLPSHGQPGRFSGRAACNYLAVIDAFEKTTILYSIPFDCRRCMMAQEPCFHVCPCSARSHGQRWLPDQRPVPGIAPPLVVGDAWRRGRLPLGDTKQSSLAFPEQHSFSSELKQ